MPVVARDGRGYSTWPWKLYVRSTRLRASTWLEGPCSGRTTGRPESQPTAGPRTAAPAFPDASGLTVTEAYRKVNLRIYAALYQFPRHSYTLLDFDRGSGYESVLTGSRPPARGPRWAGSTDSWMAGSTGPSPSGAYCSVRCAVRASRRGENSAAFDFRKGREES
jgi:hypothetical protein